jgi:hypothetical protein
LGAGAGTGAGVGVAADVSVSERDEALVRIFVPFPSLASTAALPKETVAVPGAFTWNTSVMTLPLRPLNPGFGIIPSMDAVPAAFE